jgi:fatty-acyl-CoA synthase
MALAIDSGRSTPALPSTTIGGALDAAVQRWGDREALVSVEQGVRFTYRELDVAVDRLARGLLARGVAKGDRVGIWAPNCAEWTLVQYATARLGAVLVTVNPAYRTHELQYVVNQAGLSLLIAAPNFKTSDYTAMVNEAAPDLDAVFLGSAEWAGLFMDGDPLPDRNLRPDDAINIQYTSGTTGFPKGATLSHSNILGNGFLVGQGCGYTEADRVCVPVSFYHCTRAAAIHAGRRYATARAATIRRHLINLAGRVARHARHITLHLPEHWPWQHAWSNLLAATGPPPA